MRVNLSIAIVAMVNNTAIHGNDVNDNNTVSDSCQADIRNSSVNHHVKDGPFAWDEETQGNILGSFFYGYVLTQLPGGRMSELVGGKWLYGIGVLVSAIFTLLTPVAANTSHLWSQPWLLYVVRVIEGLGEGVTYPAMMAILSRWAPPGERSRLT